MGTLTVTIDFEQNAREDFLQGTPSTPYITHRKTCITPYCKVIPTWKVADLNKDMTLSVDEYFIFGNPYAHEAMRDHEVLMICLAGSDRPTSLFLQPLSLLEYSPYSIVSDFVNFHTHVSD